MESSFRDIAPAGLKLIETLRWDAEHGFIRLPRHLARCARTCRAFGIAFDPGFAEMALNAEVGPQTARVRLTVDLAGQIEVTATPVDAVPPNTIWRIGVSAQVLASGDPFLQVKTTERALYDRARADLPEGLDEVIFVNERGEACEGTITNIFADLGVGMVTPPLSCGVLPGVLREDLLAGGDCAEAVLTIADLQRARGLWVGNSLRGLIRARIIG